VSLFPLFFRVMTSIAIQRRQRAGSAVIKWQIFHRATNRQERERERERERENKRVRKGRSPNDGRARRIPVSFIGILHPRHYPCSAKDRRPDIPRVSLLMYSFAPQRRGIPRCWARYNADKMLRSVKLDRLMADDDESRKIKAGSRSTSRIGGGLRSPRSRTRTGTRTRIGGGFPELATVSCFQTGLTDVTRMSF